MIDIPKIAGLLRRRRFHIMAEKENEERDFLRLKNINYDLLPFQLYLIKGAVNPVNTAYSG